LLRRPLVARAAGAGRPTTRDRRARVAGVAFLTDDD
jgi:hypothetical protein